MVENSANIYLFIYFSQFYYLSNGYGIISFKPSTENLFLRGWTLALPLVDEFTHLLSASAKITKLYKQ